MYDRYGTVDGMPGSSGFVDFSDIFGGMGVDDIFSSIFGGSRRHADRARDGPVAPARYGHLALHHPEEAAQGCKKTIRSPPRPVRDCDGSGSEEGDQEQPCPPATARAM
ncbi:MAG: hypothetical protein ACLTKG_06365 [Collinsella intestinalis]